MNELIFENAESKQEEGGFSMFFWLKSYLHPPFEHPYTPTIPDYEFRMYDTGEKSFGKVGELKPVGSFSWGFEKDASPIEWYGYDGPLTPEMKEHFSKPPKIIVNWTEV